METSRISSNLLKTFYFVILFVLIVLLVPYNKGLFFREGFRWLYILFLSFCLSFTLTPIIRHFAKKWGALDYPDDRKVHKQATPLLGGIPIYIAFFVAVYSNNIFTRSLLGILSGGFLIFLVSVIDDIYGVKAWIKLLIQIIATLIVVHSGIVLNLFTKIPLGMELNVFLTFLWVIGITNSFNFFDGMDGLASGLGIITAFFIGIVAFQTNQPYFGWIAIAIVGSCIGFLPYNFRINNPATIFLGDAGSNFLGFTLACLAILGEWADNNPIVSLATPLLIFWIFIFDMTYITITRIATKRVTNFREWIDYVGRDHLHHRLAILLSSEKKSVIFIFLLCVCMGIGSIALRYARTLDALLLLVQAAIIVGLVTILEVGSKKSKIVNE
ncbi:MAG: MraY family glycosyltransferase [Thermodesulfobacteriota bacterium]|nr:MraY family glycosyltransferase [Thermodesulfobacteriota bacterium]